MNFRIRKACPQSRDILRTSYVTLGTVSDFSNFEPVSLSITDSQGKTSTQQPHT